jgi:hypothetical protein
MAAPKPADRQIKDAESRSVSYVGHKTEVYTVWQGITFNFPQGQPVKVPAALAVMLEAQSDKFKGEEG